MAAQQKRMVWKAAALLSFIAAGFAVAPYLSFDPGLSRVPLNPSFAAHFPLLLAHIFVSFIALIIGWAQFVPGLRRKWPKLHRLVGRLYLICVGIGGITGLIVGMFAASYIRQMAFLTLAVLWLFTGWKGYRAARLKKMEAHSAWMIRNYAITLVAATARIITPLCMLLYIAGHGIEEAGGIAGILKQVLEVNIWIGLVINMAIAEWVLLFNRYDRALE